MTLDISLEGALPAGLSAQKVKKAVEVTCAMAGVKGDGIFVVSVTTVTDAKIRKMNRDFRGKDKVTDVLSFRQDDAKGFVMPKGDARDGEHPLGDIFISLPQVKRQAKTIGRAAKDEYVLMVVHGVLHLLGHDHVSLADEKKMFGLQHDILTALGVI